MVAFFIYSLLLLLQLPLVLVGSFFLLLGSISSYLVGVSTTSLKTFGMRYVARNTLHLLGRFLSTHSHIVLRCFAS